MEYGLERLAMTLENRKAMSRKILIWTLTGSIPLWVYAAFVYQAFCIRAACISGLAAAGMAIESDLDLT